jgi:hypothetical protein
LRFATCHVRVLEPKQIRLKVRVESPSRPRLKRKPVLAMQPEWRRFLPTGIPRASRTPMTAASGLGPSAPRVPADSPPAADRAADESVPLVHSRGAAAPLSSTYVHTSLARGHTCASRSLVGSPRRDLNARLTRAHCQWHWLNLNSCLRKSGTRALWASRSSGLRLGNKELLHTTVTQFQTALYTASGER